MTPRVRRVRVTVRDVAPTRAPPELHQPACQPRWRPHDCPQQPLTHQHGTTDRVIRDTDVGPTCGVHDAPPVVTTALAAALPWPRMIPLRRTPMTTEDWNHHFQILLKSYVFHLSNFNYDTFDKKSQLFDSEFKDPGLCSRAPERPCEPSALYYEFGYVT